MKGLHYVAVDPKIASDPKVAEMAKALRKDRHWVAGHFPAFLGEVAAHCPAGDLSEISDDLLDQWAGEVKGWGALVRRLLCHGGVLASWRKYNGRSLEKLAADRARKNLKVIGTSTELPRNLHGQSAPVTIPYLTIEEIPKGISSLEGEISPSGRAA